ncbi:hypothetical protein LWI29_016381 [Acer saccharum]|uniref:Uncharacterized protein n=1 Tax=Acer saccharum TaxID=4024 RepID=A0AA39RKZ5_ACESA|nr:hypothetical protein LWI29_016381 [Acer saccharum]
MDPSLRSFLFNRMMQAMELGDKCTTDKIKSLIRNFCPDSPIPISVYVPSSEDTFIPNISPPSSNSDSPTMPRSSRPTSSKRHASRAPRESLLDAQTTVDSDVEDHQRDRLHFSLDRPCSFDTEPFIAKFLAEARIAPAQLAPNSYRILMCLCLMWKLKGYGPPTPREIRHFYTLRQVGNGGTYFLLSSPVENWIPKGVVNPGQVEVSSDEKKKGFIWGFPTSNKRWKNSWFFTGGEWGRDVPASSRRNLLAKKVPRHFTSPEAWLKAAPALLDREISHLAAVAVLPLDSRDRSFLLDEEKMISEGIFTRLHARLPRLCDFDTVCHLQARAVKNFEAASKRHAAGLAKEGIASPDGDDPSDGEDTGDVTGGGVESRQPPMRAEATATIPVAATATAATTPTATTPSRKGKEKVGVSGGVSDVPFFDADVPKTPLDPASDLAPRASRNKRPAGSTPDHAVRPPKRASRVVQYVVSSDEEGAEEPAVAETPSTQPTVREGPAEAENVATPPSEGVNEQTIPASTSPRPSSPSVAMGEPNVSSDQLRPSGQPESIDRPAHRSKLGPLLLVRVFPMKPILQDRLKPMKGTCPFLIFWLLKSAPTWLIMIYTLVIAGGTLKTSPATGRWNFSSTTTPW